MFLAGENYLEFSKINQSLEKDHNKWKSVRILGNWLYSVLVHSTLHTSILQIYHLPVINTS